MKGYICVYIIFLHIYQHTLFQTQFTSCFNFSPKVFTAVETKVVLDRIAVVTERQTW